MHLFQVTQQHGASTCWGVPSERPRIKERTFSVSTHDYDLDTVLWMRLRRQQADTARQYRFHSDVLPEAELHPQNRRALALLQAWSEETDELGSAWWDEFERELEKNRLTFRNDE